VAEQACELLNLPSEPELQTEAIKNARQSIATLCHFLGHHGRLIETMVALLSNHKRSLLQGSHDLVSDCVVLMMHDERAKKYAVRIIMPCADVCLNRLLICHVVTFESQCSGGDENLGVIAAAIRSDDLSLDDKPVGCQLTVDQLLADGVYIDAEAHTPTETKRVIPRMSLFQMYMWALNRPDDQVTFAAALRTFLKPRQSYGPSDFEEFHACAQLQYLFD
jgi:hypothetical protein